MRASGSDENILLKPPRKMDLEAALGDESVFRRKASFEEPILAQHHPSRIVDVEYLDRHDSCLGLTDEKENRRRPREAGSIHNGGLPAGVERRPAAPRPSFTCRLIQKLAGPST